MNDFIILTDTRQQKENHILKEFDKQGILHIRTTLKSGDYMALRYDNNKGIYLDYSTIVDTKKDMDELLRNLCDAKEHERIKREIAKAKKLGCKKFYFLIADDFIKNAQDIKNWSSNFSKVKGETLFKIMYTMAKRYDILFIITPKKKMGEKVIQILESGDVNEQFTK